MVAISSFQALHLLRRPLPPFFFPKHAPIYPSAATTIISGTIQSFPVIPKTPFTSLSSSSQRNNQPLSLPYEKSSLIFTPQRSYSSKTSLNSSSLNTQDEDFEEEEEDIGDDDDDVFEDDLEEKEEESLEVKDRSVVKSNVPKLTVKEKKELASYAHSLGDKLKCQLVGKSGVTSNVASSFNETLEANELLKIKVHRTCPGELDDVIKQLEEATGSVVVGQIGRTVIVYKPSLKKLQVEEKKKQARKAFVRKNIKSRPTFLKKEDALRTSGRGRRGRSRF